MEEEKSWCEKLCEETEHKIKEILDEGILKDNISYLFQLTGIHKDICNEKYWKAKEEYMRYRTYEDSYGRRARDSRGRYMEGEYGRRGVPGTGRGRYRGDDMMEDMYQNYQDYSYGRDNYGHDEGTKESLKYMLDSVKRFMKTLEEDAGSQEEVEMIKRTAQEMSR